ncbi:MAG: HNH endonuclease [Bryobacterales bacterium]|nr:HNH endonuclease [Bryobacterales bacterium]
MLPPGSGMAREMKAIGGGNEYALAPGCRIVDIDKPNFAAQLPFLRSAHTAALATSARRRPAPKTRAAHSTGVLVFLSEVLNRPVPFLSATDETLPSLVVNEGQRISVMVNRYERDPLARRACLDFHGSACSVCGMNFEYSYGETMRGFIHVHHLMPLSIVGVAHNCDPQKDLIPVCPNCHAFLHHRDPPLLPDDARALLESVSRRTGTKRSAD